MNSNDSNMAASAICHAADMVKVAWQEAAWERQRPSVIFSPKLSRDGDMWCALFGDNLQEGVAGFGPRPADAMWAFDKAWLTESGSHIIERKRENDDG
jgi:hypothetical protein